MKQLERLMAKLLGLLCAALLASVTLAAEKVTPEDAVAALRHGIESEFRANSGIGFLSFDCEIPENLIPGDPFFCEAVDEEEDRFRYRIDTAEDGMTVATVSQPATQLEAEALARMEAPCREFFERYREGDWSALWADLDPDLKSTLDATELAQILAPVREQMGELRSFTVDRLIVKAEGGIDLLYWLESEQGPGLARFGIWLEEETAKVHAFLITAEPGSPLQVAMAKRTGRELLEGLLAEPIESFDVPLEDLRSVGDVVEGMIRPVGGETMPVRVEQIGPPDDFDVVDVNYQILDARWLLTRQMESEERPVDAIHCPQRAVPDGGQLECTISLVSGERFRIVMARQGSSHRILEMQEP
jgi:hypothetical protein